MDKKQTKTVSDDIKNSTIIVSGTETNVDKTKPVLSNWNVATFQLSAGSSIQLIVDTKAKIGNVAPGTYKGTFNVNKFDLSNVKLSNLTNGSDLYNNVRIQLGSFTDVSPIDIKNDSVGIGIYQGINSEPLAQDAVAKACQIYTVKLVSGTSSYFTGDEKDITVISN